MRAPALTILYQFDPWHPSVGGIQNVILLFLKFAPKEFTLQIVGTTADPKVPPGKWIEREFYGRTINFLPLMALPQADMRTAIPTTIKYCCALAGKKISSDFVHFHRIEPSLCARAGSGERTLFIHNDIQKKIYPADGDRSFLWSRFPRGYLALESFLMRRFDRVAVGNSAAFDFYREQYTKMQSRLYQFSNPVDEEIFTPLTPERREDARRDMAKKLKLAEETQFVLSAGRLHPVKDPLLLLRSFALLKNDKTHLLVAGDGELRAQFEAEARRLGVAERMTMLGSLESDRLRDLYQISRLLALTSVHEGLPLVALEALACGVPIVTTRAGDLPRLLDAQSGIVIESRDPAAISEAMERIFRDPSAFPVAACVRAVKSHSARRIIESEFSSMLSRWNPDKK